MYPGCKLDHSSPEHSIALLPCCPVALGAVSSFLNQDATAKVKFIKYFLLTEQSEIQVQCQTRPVGYWPVQIHCRGEDSRDGQTTSNGIVKVGTRGLQQSTGRGGFFVAM